MYISEGRKVLGRRYSGAKILRSRNSLVMSKGQKGQLSEKSYAVEKTKGPRRHRILQVITERVKEGLGQLRKTWQSWLPFTWPVAVYKYMVGLACLFLIHVFFQSIIKASLCLSLSKPTYSNCLHHFIVFLPLSPSASRFELF
jgi:hypothetical protein